MGMAAHPAAQLPALPWKLGVELPQQANGMIE
jgi:hypothetical protein